VLAKRRRNSHGPFGILRSETTMPEVNLMDSLQASLFHCGRLGPWAS